MHKMIIIIIFYIITYYFIMDVTENTLFDGHRRCGEDFLFSHPDFVFTF